MAKFSENTELTFEMIESSSKVMAEIERIISDIRKMQEKCESNGLIDIEIGQQTLEQLYGVTSELQDVLRRMEYARQDFIKIHEVLFTPLFPGDGPDTPFSF